jgi:hypothetical protein
VAATYYTTDGSTPTPSSSQGTNGGTVGTADKTDTLTITYSEQIDATTFCSTWSNSGTQSISGTGVVVIQIADSGSNDTLTVTSVGSSNCGGSANFHLGSITLGGDYVAATRTFAGSKAAITWDPTARTLTLTLDNASGAVNSGIAAGTPTYTPSSSLKDMAGNTINTSAFSPSGTSRF